MIQIQLNDILTDFDAITDTFERVYNLQDRSHYVQESIEEDKTALVLYCQQFAFAPEMVEPCAEILLCNNRELDYKYDFPADFEPHTFDE